MPLFSRFSRFSRFSKFSKFSNIVKKRFTVKNMIAISTVATATASGYYLYHNNLLFAARKNLTSMQDIVHAGTASSKISVSINTVADLLLHEYGLSLAQIQALRFMLQAAGIVNADHLLDGKVANINELINLTLELISVTQQHFTIRVGKQERWEVETAAWIKYGISQPEFSAALYNLQMIEPVFPAEELELPMVEPGLSVIKPALPVVQSGLPMAQSGLPVADSALPVVQSGLPVADSALPVVQSGLSMAQSRLLADNYGNIHEHGKATAYHPSEHAAPTNVIAILGATQQVMQSRFTFVQQLLTTGKLSAKNSWIALLTGERYVTIDRKDVKLDGSLEELTLLAKQLGKENIATLTETDLMVNLAKNFAFDSKFNDHWLLIDTKQDHNTRPTTETTVIDFCKWLQQHPEIKKVIFISNQPHVEYQQAIIKQVLAKFAMEHQKFKFVVENTDQSKDKNHDQGKDTSKAQAQDQDQDQRYDSQNDGVKFEVIGPAYQLDDTLINNYAKQANYIIQSFGSMLWAKTPAVLQQLELRGGVTLEPEVVTKFQALFKHQPLIFKSSIGKNPPKNKSFG